MESKHEIVEISSDSCEDADVHEEWVVDLSEAQTSGGQALGVPASIRRGWFGHGPTEILVCIEGKEPPQTWELLWYNQGKQCLIGKGWYAFCRDNALSAGNIVTFVKCRGVEELLVVLDRLDG
ncbi:DNA-binding barrel domain superfamily [Sesbania bispinosa]|nr:DNA-binding barrel domain superfamily [Sesbania bispinosa]